MIKEIWNPDLCPLAILPWLAWANSVDVWDDNWSEQQKRDTIKASFVTHATKGTPGSIKRQIAALGYTPEIEEWFQRGYSPYTFDVNVEIGTAVFNDDLTVPVLKIINTFKNIRSELLTVRFYRSNTSSGFVAVAATTGKHVTLGYWPDEI